MNKARITLSAIAIMALVGGAFAFKAARFTGTPAWTTTNSITTIVNGRTYATIAQGLCTTSLYITNNPLLPPVQTLKTTATLPPTTVVATATDGSGFTTAITTFPCTTTVTRVTTVN
jgi:hypothetical protein